MNTWHINTKVIKSSSAGILVRRESGSKNKPRRIILWGFYLSYRHFAYRIANADDIISLCDIYDIFGGGLLDFDFFHLDAYDTVDFQDTPDRSVLYLNAILVGRDFDRRGIFLPRSKCLDSRFISLRVNRITCGECKCQSDDMYKLHLLVPKFVQM